MTPPIANAPALDTWTNLSGFQQLRAEAGRDGGKAALPVVARQFEAIFTQMMLKSMREANASIGSGYADSDAGNSYQDMADHQLALTLANGKNGLGIAQMLIRQLGGREQPAPPADAAAPGTALSGAAAITNANVRALLQLGAAPGTDAAGSSPTDALAALSTGATATDADRSPWSGLLDSLGAAGQSGVLGSLAQGVAGAASVAAKLLPGGDPAGFVRALAPHARAAAARLGVSPRALLAQAALETGWGQHLPSHGDGSSSNNLFGIKAGSSWDGDRVSVPTLEYENGVAVRRRDQFRAYASPAASFADYADLLRDNPRYAGALGKGENVAGFAHALVRGGYATDPAYAAKITAIANSPQMREALAALQAAGSPP